MGLLARDFLWPEASADAAGGGEDGDHATPSTSAFNWRQIE